MPDKLTDSEIVKALRRWLEEIRKARQAYLEKVNEEHYPSMRYEYLLSDTIHEINRLQAENQRLMNQTTTYITSISELTNEVERLRADRESAMLLAADIIAADKTLKAEAYKEFAEKLKFIMCPSVKLEYKDIDNLLKELVGE